MSTSERKMRVTGRRLGPLAEVQLYCRGCLHHREDHVMDKSGVFAGTDHYCAGTAYPVWQCMGTTDRTPAWCPMRLPQPEQPTNQTSEGGNG